MGENKNDIYTPGTCFNPRKEEYVCPGCGNSNFVIYLVHAGATTYIETECRICGEKEEELGTY